MKQRNEKKCLHKLSFPRCWAPHAAGKVVMNLGSDSPSL